MAYDDGGNLDAAHSDETVAQLFNWAVKHLTDDQRIALCEKLQHEMAGRSPSQAHDGRRYSSSSVPPSRSGPPVRQATKSEIDEICSRIPIDNVGVQPKPKPKAPSTDDDDGRGFHSRYPGADRIKVMT
jgi:hypothetical protein